MMTRKRTAIFFYKLLTCFAVLFFTLNLSGSLLAQCNNDSSNGGELKILTWNIYMLPRHVIHTGQVKRAHEIADALRNEDVDIIVFEEAFDRKCRSIIWNGLKDSFPFQTGKPGRNVFWKTSGGVWIISKVPLTVVKRIYFKKSKGSDRLACKGAMLVEAEKNNACFQLVGTHLQSDLDHHDVRDVRRTQYKQIEVELLDAYRKKNIPQFVAGDFNTIKDDTVSYRQMVDIMNVSECSLKGDLCYSFDYSSNDFISNQPVKPQLIDYVFYRNGGDRKVVAQTCVKMFRKKWNDKHKDLSDHFAVSAIISMR